MTTQAMMPAHGHSTTPKFDPTQLQELCRYFNELKLLFSACNVTNSEDMKKHACRYLDIDTSKLWESIPEYDAGISFQNFRIAIHQLYPGSKDDRKWSISDMDKLVGEQLHIGIYNASNLGLYYRSFYNITKFLSTKGRISDAEQSRAFVQGFQPGLWARITRRLELKFPDHCPDDPYPLDDIHAAAKFVLAGSISSDSTLLLSAHSSAPSAIPTTSTSMPQIKSEDLMAILEKFAATLVTALAGLKTRNTTQPNSGFCLDQLKTLVCIFCGLTGHFISDCLVCQSHINEGKCKKNTEGKIVLPNGQFTPRSIPSHFIKDRIDEWTQRNPPTNVTPLLMCNIAPLTVSLMPSRGVYQITDLSTMAKDCIAQLKQEIYALPFMQTDPNVPTAPTSRPSIPASVERFIPQLPAPLISSTATNPPTSNLAPSLTSEKSLQPVIHLYNGAKKNLYLPPHERNFASTGKVKDGSSYHTQAPIQKDKITKDIFTRLMKTPIITLTPKESLLLSPKVCTKWKEQVTVHRIQQPEGNNTTNLLHNDIFVIDNPYKTYISSLHLGEIPKPFIAAKESHSIRSVIMNVNGRNPVESIVDLGSSIITMSEEVCHKLGLAYDPSIHIPLQSANGGIDQSLGLAWNVPCEVGSITLYMQIHIICNPAYDILLR
ncbi:hypothetical protein L208DRAFT_1330261 [Tricholoma matsutake]|nr:hypothetical protein L208DRAFT_1330261 [Tricholoma matsutake 945]